MTRQLEGVKPGMQAGRILAGVLVILAALWLGAYVLCALPERHWATIPTFMTAIIAAVAGAALFVRGVVP